MKLDDFLKPKKVRCINGGNHGYLTDGKVYDVIGATFGRLKIRNDNGDNHWYDMTCFELVIDSAENPLQKMELTPELEAVEPKFKVGDRVYVGLTGRIVQVTAIIDNDVVSVANKNNEVRAGVSYICHATPENHALLSKLYPHIDFEQPPKPLSGDELVRAMLTKGIKNVLCLWANGDKIVIDGLDYKGALVNINNNIVSGLTPIDWCTGEPLTQAVLDE